MVTLQMKLADADTFVPVVCAVCDRLSNDVLLGTDVIDRLNRMWWSEQMPVNDDVCDVGMSGGVNIDVMNSNVTNATSPVQSDENVSDNNAECVEVDDDDDSVLNLDDVACDKGQNVADA